MAVKKISFCDHSIYVAVGNQKIPWMEEPGRLKSTGSPRVGHDWVTLLSLFTFMHWRRKWQPTPVFLPGESQGQGSLVGCRLWGHRVRHDWSNLAAAAAAQYSCLGNLTERGAWWARVHGVAKNETWLSETACRHLAQYLVWPVERAQYNN